MVKDHLIITELPDGYIRVVPEQGYALINVITLRRYSVAEIKAEELSNFKAEPITA